MRSISAWMLDTFMLKHIIFMMVLATVRLHNHELSASGLLGATVKASTLFMCG